MTHDAICRCPCTCGHSGGCAWCLATKNQMTTKPTKGQATPLCEWNPVQNRRADGDSGSCSRPATEIVAASWRLCNRCCRLPVFALMTRREILKRLGER